MRTGASARVAIAVGGVDAAVGAAVRITGQQAPATVPRLALKVATMVRRRHQGQQKLQDLRITGLR
jgi:hypothetical protein